MVMLANVDQYRANSKKMRSPPERPEPILFIQKKAKFGLMEDDNMDYVKSKFGKRTGWVK